MQTDVNQRFYIYLWLLLEMMLHDVTPVDLYRYNKEVRGTIEKIVSKQIWLDPKFVLLGLYIITWANIYRPQLALRQNLYCSQTKRNSLVETDAVRPPIAEDILYIKV